MNLYITTEEFVTMLRKTHFPDENAANPLQKSKEEGWVEPFHILHGTDWIERIAAAGILHQFIKIILQEKDEDNWEPAKKLKDIYDCRTCVNHVAQVYCKGIMGSITTKSETVIFGMQELLRKDEAVQIVKRTFTPALRYQIIANPKKKRANSLSAKQAACLLAQYKERKDTLYLLDVRPVYEYDKGHLPDAVSIPLGQLLEFPLQTGEDKNAPVLIYCEKGYQSEIAASCLLEAGYTNVSFFGFLGELLANKD